MEKQCMNCNRIYSAVKSNQLFCSKSCRSNYYNPIKTFMINNDCFTKIKNGETREINLKKSERYEKIITNIFGQSLTYDNGIKWKINTLSKRDVNLKNAKTKEILTVYCSVCETESYYKLKLI